MGEKMSIQDTHRLYQLEALLAQAIGLLVQVDDAVKAMKPQQKRDKKIDPVHSFDALVKSKTRRKSVA
jgi:hypothetical protein